MSLVRGLDEDLEPAIKKWQVFHRVEVTGD